MNHLPESHRPVCALTWLHPLVRAALITVWAALVAAFAGGLWRISQGRRAAAVPSVITAALLAFAFAVVRPVEPSSSLRHRATSRGEATPTAVGKVWDEWSIDAGKVYYFFPACASDASGTAARRVVYGSDVAGKGYHTAVNGNLTLDFIRRRGQGAAPWFAVYSPYAPHGPAPAAPWHYQRNGRSRLRFDNAKAPRGPAHRLNVDHAPLTRQQRTVTTNEVRALDRFYRRQLGALRAVDDAVAELWTAVLPDIDNTLVLYTTDNAVHYGQYGLYYGKQTWYDRDLRVPLYVAGMTAQGGVRTARPFQLPDIGPSLVALAGIEVDATTWAFDGHDESAALAGTFEPLLPRLLPVAQFDFVQRKARARPTVDWLMYRHPHQHPDSQFCGGRFIADDADLTCVRLIRRTGEYTDRLAFDLTADQAQTQLTPNNQAKRCWDALDNFHHEWCTLTP